MLPSLFTRPLLWTQEVILQSAAAEWTFQELCLNNFKLAQLQVTCMTTSTCSACPNMHIPLKFQSQITATRVTDTVTGTSSA